MSLKGIVTDLSMTELLSFLTRSGRSGVLEVASDDNVAWFGLTEGAIRRVALAEGLEDADELLKRMGLEGKADPEQVELCLREAAEAALAEVMSWSSGDFRFASGSEGDGPWCGPAGIELASPLNWQAGEPIQAAPLNPKAQAVPYAPTGIVIVVDSDLAVLEALKGELVSCAGQVHVFQDAGGALARLKQYLTDQKFPSLVMSREVRDPYDPSEASNWVGLVERVRLLSKRVRIVVLGKGRVPKTAPIDAQLPRPNLAGATRGELADFYEDLRQALDLKSSST